MSAKPTTLSLAGAALFAAIALAQASTGHSSPSNSISASSLEGDWRASKIVGLSVYNDTDEKLGSINDLLVDKSGNIKAVVLGVGGFLGLGEHLVAISFDKIKFVSEPVSGGKAGGGPATNHTTTTGSVTNGSNTMAKPDSRSPDHALFDATEDELRATPGFKYST